MKRAGSAVELRSAPKARHAAHPQERQHSAAGGGTRDRVRPAGAPSPIWRSRHLPSEKTMRLKHNQSRETVPQSVPVNVLISAKCWSEWQDLNLRPPRPNEACCPLRTLGPATNRTLWIVSFTNCFQ